MPWRETRVIDERQRLLETVLSGQLPMAEACRRAGVSRKTGYKFLRRYQQYGLGGLRDFSRAPHHQPFRVSSEVEDRIVSLRRQRPSWGPLKLLQFLEGADPRQDWPSKSTIHQILRRHGLIESRKRRRRATPSESPFNVSSAPNDTWSIDFKGWFRTKDGSRCDPLTLTDDFSRYALECRALSIPDTRTVQNRMVRVFRKYGLPGSMRSDNGPPFSSPRAIGGLSHFCVWLVRLGIRIERIEPGCPQQNGRHERFHKTLKQEVISPARASLRAQQEAFDRFRGSYNEERPHEALGGKPPGTIYAPSEREYPEVLPSLEYPSECLVRRVWSSGSFKLRGRKYFLSEALEGEEIGLLQVGEQRYQVLFGPLDLGVLDEEGGRIQGHRKLRYREEVSPMCSDSDGKEVRERTYDDR